MTKYGIFPTQAETHKGKEKWVNTIKKLLMESIPDLPDKARMLIMAGFPTGTACALKLVLSHFILLCIGYLCSMPTSNRSFYETCTSGHCMHT
jgi:hypothetical protein